MKKFLVILVVVAVAFAMTSTANAQRGGHYGHGGFGGRVVSGFGWGLGFGLGAAVVNSVCYRSYPCYPYYSSVVIERSGYPVYYPGPAYYPGPTYYPQTVYPQTVVVSSGHYETRVVDYRTTVRPVVHPPVLGTYWNGTSLSQYVAVQSWTEQVVVQEPVYGQVWVP